MSIIVSQNLILYNKAVDQMKAMVNDIAQNRSGDMIWLLEHYPIYTSGYITYNNWVSKYGDMINGIPLVESERGGQITYHGPGQRVCYFIIDLKRRYHRIDLRKFLDDISQIIINVLAEFDIDGIKDPIYPGIWVKCGNSINKIAAIGIRVSKGISYHGIALNVNTNLSPFQYITPCGIDKQDRGVTSIKEIFDKEIQFEEIDQVLIKYISIKYPGLA